MASLSISRDPSLRAAAQLVDATIERPSTRPTPARTASRDEPDVAPRRPPEARTVADARRIARAEEAGLRGYFERRLPRPTKVPPAPKPAGDPAGFDNPNLQFYRAGSTAPVGTLAVDPSRGTSTWNVHQWNSVEHLDPTNPAQRLAWSDPELGDAVSAIADASRRVAVFQDPTRPGGYVYEVAAGGGTNSDIGAKNTFIDTTFDPPRALGEGASLDLDYKVRYAAVNKEQDFDAKNLAQGFVGLIFRNRETGETIFAQRVITESNGNGTGNLLDGAAGTNSPIYTRPMDPSGALVGTGDEQWRHGHVDLGATLRDALGQTYARGEAGPDGQPTVTTRGITDQDPAHWDLTGIYMGTETAGDSALTLQFRGVDLKT